AAVVVAVLTLGIGVNTMIFCMVYGVLGRPWPLPQFDRVMTITEANPKQDVRATGLSWLDFPDLREQLKSFTAIRGFWQHSGPVTIGAEPDRRQAANITARLP